jgi:hypothetical protein
MKKFGSFAMLVALVLTAVMLLGRMPLSAEPIVVTANVESPIAVTLQDRLAQRSKIANQTLRVSDGQPIVEKNSCSRKLCQGADPKGRNCCAPLSCSDGTCVQF